jgi:hypothetical protein
MQAVFGLYAKKEDARKAYQDLNEKVEDGRRVLMLEAEQAGEINQLLANRPERGALWGAGIGLVLGGVIGVIIAAVVAYTPGETFPIVYPLAGALISGVIAAYLGSLYSTRLHTAHAQAFKETLAEGGALLLIPAAGSSARTLEAEMRLHGGQLVNTYEVYPNEFAALHGSQPDHTQSPASA